MSELVRVPVTIKSGKNHGRYGEVVGYSMRSGGYEVDFSPLWEVESTIHDAAVLAKVKRLSKLPKKRFYAFDRLRTMSPEDGLKLYNMAPPSRRKEKHIAQLVAERLIGRTSVNTYGPTSGRITSSKPNTQQLPSAYDWQYNVCRGTGLMKLEVK